MNAPRTLREFRAQGRDPFAVFRASDVLAIDGAWLERASAGAPLMFWDDEDDGDLPFQRAPYDLLDGGVGRILVEGPLTQRGWMCWQGYDSVARSLSAALADENVRAVVLVMNSPGGVVAGLFEAVRRMRAEIEASGKRVVCYVDELAASAGYALACVADEIVLPETGCVGSVGVIASMQSVSRMLDKAGVDVALVTSGDEKADGYAQKPISKEALARLQETVDMFAGVFHRHVAARRPLSVEAVAALEAGVRYGAGAVKAGLADRVGSLGDVLAGLATPDPAPSAGEAAKPMKPAMTAAEIDAVAKTCVDATGHVDPFALAVALSVPTHGAVRSDRPHLRPDVASALDALAAADRSPPPRAAAPNNPAGAPGPTAAIGPNAPETTIMTLPSSSPVLAALGAQSEADGLANVTALIDARKVVRAMTGATTDAEAHGILEAWKRDSGALVALRAEVSAERATRDVAERRQLLEEGVRDKKITPAEASADGQPEGWTTALTTPALRSFMAQRKGIVAPPPAPPAKKDGAGALTDAQRAIADQMNISHAEYAQHLAAQAAESAED